MGMKYLDRNHGANQGAGADRWNGACRGLLISASISVMLVGAATYTGDCVQMLALAGADATAIAHLDSLLASPRTARCGNHTIFIGRVRL